VSRRPQLHNQIANTRCFSTQGDDGDEGEADFGPPDNDDDDAAAAWAGGRADETDETQLNSAPNRNASLNLIADPEWDEEEADGMDGEVATQIAAREEALLRAVNVYSYVCIAYAFICMYVYRYG